MAPSSARTKVEPTHEKLARLPANAKVSKRRLVRPPLSVRHAATQQVIYVSSRTPFMSAITRLRKTIAAITARRTQSILDTAGKNERDMLNARDIVKASAQDLDARESAWKNKRGEEVLIKGTGKAIETVLGIAGWLQAHALAEGVAVRLQTGSTWTVDDVEVADDDEAKAETMDVDKQDGEQTEIPESRARSVSVLIIRVAVL